MIIVQVPEPEGEEKTDIYNQQLVENLSTKGKQPFLSIIAKYKKMITLDHHLNRS